ncbi:uncharacterized protein H6S33_002537 [Morchella sextelata]|uniref:uncharacterized protein n=1 Tax=Morchella sextelata TaxID=1174677 RepID=UPI001D040DC3|nr:uncharacterized protein H6S33_002537 [Morchella sextelata]KAH0607503.1 hypothetical protein H6S33_002537 [Morchella sextelata]
MQQSGFRSAPVSKAFLFTLVATSLLASIVDVKHYFHIQIVPHLWVYRQLWRVLIWQTCYANAGELLFASLVIYHLRTIERLFGTRKFSSFLVYSFIATSVIAPILLALLFRPFTAWHMNYLPPGPTPIIFAALAQYHASIPGIYKFKLLTTSSSADGDADAPGITLSDKFYVYFLSAQLALCQPPGSMLSAAVGWVVGYAWRMDLLPKSKWRLPSWLFTDSQAGEFETLRRRLRDQDGVTTGATQTAVPTAPRPLVRQVLDQFRGSF